MIINQRPRNIILNGARYPGGNYPFDKIEVGGCFFVPHTRASPETVSDMVRRRNRQNRGNFIPDGQWSVTLYGEQIKATKVTRLPDDGAHESVDAAAPS